MLRPLLQQQLRLFKDYADKYWSADAPQAPHGGRGRPPTDCEHHRLLSDSQILNRLGRFWDLFNQVQSGRARGVLGVCCVPDPAGLERYLSPGKSVQVLKNPPEKPPSEWRREASEVVRTLQEQSGICHIVILVPSGHGTGERPEAHCLRQIRSLASLDGLAEKIRQGKICLHAWMEDERRKFRVLDPETGLFVSPLSLSVVPLPQF